MSAEGIIIKHFMISLEYTYSVHASSSQLLNVSSRLKSTEVDMPLSSQVESDVLKSTAVDLGSFLASSRVTFLYLSDSQV